MSPFARRAALLLVLVGAACPAGCSLFPPGDDSQRDSGRSGTTEPDSKDSRVMGFLFGWLGESEEKDPAETPVVPTPRKITIGTIHLVHEEGRFVLIRATRLSEVPEQAELMAYSAGGRPSARLRISPERKGAFLVADILEGTPRVNDEVVLFGMDGAGGPTGSQGAPLPGASAPEILE